MKNKTKIFLFCFLLLSIGLNSKAMTFESGSSPGNIANVSATAVFVDPGDSSGTGEVPAAEKVETNEPTGEIESDTKDPAVANLVRVDFFRSEGPDIISDFLTRGEEIPSEYYLGSAVVNENQTVTLVDVNDDNLTRILTSPYTTYQGGVEDGLMVTKELTLDPETEPLAHLKTIAAECFRKGYLALRVYSQDTVDSGSNP